MTERILADKAVLCRPGERAETVFRVRSGALRVRPATGGEMRLLLAGEVFGVEVVLAGGWYGAEVTAHGPAVVEALTRDEVLAAAAANPEAALPLVRAALDARAGGPAAADVGAVGRGWRLLPLTPMLAEQVGADGVLVARSPFLVGRLESGNGRSPADLALRDRRPYNLSRRHFAIERTADGALVRDCTSRLGTFVNGVRLGAGGPEVVPLAAGDNEIIAGTPSSPIRFSFRVE